MTLNTDEFDKLNKKGTTKDGRSRSKIAKASKQRGKTGERFFADILSKETGMSFQRIPNSGMMVGMSNRKRLVGMGKIQHLISLGDIICPENLEYYYIIESKNYKDLSFHQLINPGNCKELIDWLKELLYDVESAYMHINYKEPIGLLCIKITRRGSWVIFNENYLFKRALMKINLQYPYLKFHCEIDSKLLKENGWENIFIMTDFKSFIQNNKQELFKKKE